MASDETLLSAALLTDLLEEVQPAHAAALAAVAHVAAGRQGRREVARRLIDQARRHQQVAPGLEEALLARPDADLLCAWAESGLAADPSVCLRAAWDGATDDQDYVTVLESAALPAADVADLLATADDEVLPAVAGAARPEVTAFILQQLADADGHHAANAQGEGYKPGESLAARVLTTAQAPVPEEVLRECVRRLPARPSFPNESAMRRWRSMMRDIARRHPQLPARLLQPDVDPTWVRATSTDGLIFWTDLAEVGDLLPADLFTVEVRKQLGRIDTYLDRVRDTRDPVRTQPPAEPADERPPHESAVSTATYAICRLDFLLPVPLRRTRPWDRHSPVFPPDVDQRTQEHLADEVLARAGALIRAADPEALAGDTGAAGLIEGFVRDSIDTATQGELDAVARVVAASLARARYGGQDHVTWSRLNTLAEGARAKLAHRIATQTSPTPTADDPSVTEKVRAAAWARIAADYPSSTDLDELLAGVPDPERTLVEVVLEAPLVTLRALGLLKRRGLRESVTELVLRSEFCTPGAVLKLPVTALAQHLWDATSRRRLADAVLAVVGDRAQVWADLAVRPCPTGNEQSWRPLGSVLTELVRTYDRAAETGDLEAAPTLAALEGLGMSTSEARGWVKSGLPMRVVLHWSSIGVKGTAAGDFVELGVTEETIGWCLENKLTAINARRYSAAGLSIGDVIEMTASDRFTGEDAEGFMKAGVKGRERIDAYRDAGLWPGDVEAFARRGVTTLAEATRWKSLGLDSYRLRQLSAFSNEEVVRLVTMVPGRDGLGYDRVPHLDLDLVQHLIDVGVDTRWAPVLAGVGLFTKSFIGKHREQLVATPTWKVGHGRADEARVLAVLAQAP